MNIPEPLIAAAGGATGWITAVVILYWMLATDRLVTGAAHRREIEEKDKRIEERLADRDRIEDKQEETIKVQRDQIERLSVVGEAFVRIMTAIDSLTNRGKQ